MLEMNKDFSLLKNAYTHTHEYSSITNMLVIVMVNFGINLTRLRDSQIASKPSFLGLSLEAVPTRQ